MYKSNFTNPWIFLTSSKLSMTAIASSNAALDRRQAFSWAHQGKLSMNESIQKFTHHLLLKMIVAIFYPASNKTCATPVIISAVSFTWNKNIYKTAHDFSPIQELTCLLEPCGKNAKPAPDNFWLSEFYVTQPQRLDRWPTLGDYPQAPETLVEFHRR